MIAHYYTCSQTGLCNSYACTTPQISSASVKDSRQHDLSITYFLTSYKSHFISLSSWWAPFQQPPSWAVFTKQCCMQLSQTSVNWPGFSHVKTNLQCQLLTEKIILIFIFFYFTTHEYIVLQCSLKKKKDLKASEGKTQHIQSRRSYIPLSLCYNPCGLFPAHSECRGLETIECSVLRWCRRDSSCSGQWQGFTGQLWLCGEAGELPSGSAQQTCAPDALCRIHWSPTWETKGR